MKESVDSHKSLIDDANRLSSNLKRDLGIAKSLYTASDDQLAGHNIMGAESRQHMAQRIKEIFTYASQRPTYENGLSNKTQLAAKAALRVINTKLVPIISDEHIAPALKEYNDNYADRMATEQMNNHTGRIEGYKKRRTEKAQELEATSVKREERRTGIASYREAVEAERAAAESAKGDPVKC